MFTNLAIVWGPHIEGLSDEWATGKWNEWLLLLIFHPNWWHRREFYGQYHGLRMWLELPIIRELNGIGEGIDPELPPTTQYTQHPLITSEPNIQCRRGFPTHGLYSDQVVGGKKLLRISWGIPFPDQNYPPPQNEPPLFPFFGLGAGEGMTDLPLMMENSCGCL